MLSPLAAMLDATLLDASEELAGAEELTGIEELTGAEELAGAEELSGVAELATLELDGVTELLDEELEDVVVTGLLLPPPPLPPQAARPATINERAQVLIRDCIVIPKLRCCYRRLGFVVLRAWRCASCKRNLFRIPRLLLGGIRPARRLYRDF